MSAGLRNVVGIRCCIETEGREDVLFDVVSIGRADQELREVGERRVHVVIVLPGFPEARRRSQVFQSTDLEKMCGSER